MPTDQTGSGSLQCALRYDGFRAMVEAMTQRAERFRGVVQARALQQVAGARSMGMTPRSCELDMRTGGKCRLAFGDEPANPVAFFSEYLEVIPNKHVVWTNEESGDAGSVTAAMFEERDGKTLRVMSELSPTKEALAAAGTGAQEATNGTFGQLDELLAQTAAR